MCTAHDIRFKALVIIINNYFSVGMEDENHHFPTPGAIRHVQAWQVCAVDYMLPQTPTLLFHLILSAPSFSMTVFAALKWTLFYSRLELRLD